MDLPETLLTVAVVSEVYKARSKATSAIVALKKILMHNEKDGVSVTVGMAEPGRLAHTRLTVSYYSSP